MIDKIVKLNYQQEFITKIIWRVDGKIKEIQREPGVNNRTLRFDYDAAADTTDFLAKPFGSQVRCSPKRG